MMAKGVKGFLIGGLVKVLVRKEERDRLVQSIW
jgi:hypothetical protein